MNYSDEYRVRLCTADEAVRLVKNGDWVDYASNNAKPVLLDRALARRRDELHGVKIRGNLTPGPLAVVECDPEMEHFVYHTWHCSGYERKLCDAGRAFFTPMIFRNLGWYYRTQLTVNVAAVLTCFLAPLFGENEILTVIQLLVVNLAMDTLAAIAFGSEPALMEYMKEKPIARDASIVTGKMMSQVVVSGLYITAMCLCIRFVPALQHLLGAWSTGVLDTTLLNSAVFATFMMAISFNGFNARTEHTNPFEHLERNKNFLLVIGALLVLQFLFVTFGGAVLSVEPLSWTAWLVCLLIAFLIIPIDIIRKAITSKKK